MTGSHGASSNSGTSAKLLNDFQLGDSLGKGAFGQVYRALNWATGETVAVKEIQLSNIPKGELGQIMSEIDLLKNLNHPNIVKYKGFVKTREYLYIILEFCENGSLVSISKRFGKFPENLVAVYISQVLDGLVYLHDQGVIHRDIKGANILTTKDGAVKLADFGVASSTTTGGASDDAVVGSPYWMAPEVIEQFGATTASDIWSVGCTVIELLEGRPPYHFLKPMPALYRIVQDDCPPIPEGASPIVKDFLCHCFQKDYNLRISAKKLLRHPWMVAAKKSMEDNSGRRSSEQNRSGSGANGRGASERPQSKYNFDEAVLKVQEWNEALKSPSKPSKNPGRQRTTSLATGSPIAVGSPILMSESLNASSSHTHLTPTIPLSSSIGSLPSSNNLIRSRKISAVASGNSKGSNAPLAMSGPLALQQPEEQTDNWDDDFEEGISLSKLQALEKASAEDLTQNSSGSSERNENDSETIRPLATRSPGGSLRDPHQAPVPVAKPPPGAIAPIVEDYSDLAVDEDDEWQEKFSDFKMKNSVRKGLFHPDDLKTLGLGGLATSPGPKTAPLPDMNGVGDGVKRSFSSGSGSGSGSGSRGKATRPSLSPLAPTSSALYSSSQPLSASSAVRSHSHSHSHSRSSSLVGSANGSFGKEGAGKLKGHSDLMQDEFGKYAEDDDEDYDDVFGKPNGGSTEQPMQTLQLNTRLSSKSWLGDDTDEEDPFAEIDEGYEEDDLEANLQRDKYARLTSAINQLVDELNPDAPDFQIRDACDELLNILSDTPEMQGHLVSSHGMLALLEVLERKNLSREVIMKLLQIVNLLVTSDAAFLESFCLIGGIPVMMGFTSKRYPSECRLEASNFIQLLCHVSVLTLQMFISCRGLKVLVDLLDEDFAEQSDLIVHALVGIGSVFELQSPTTKNDFCRMFIREGLLDPLSSALLNVMANDGDKAATMKSKILQILLVFCQVSQSDIHVRNALGVRKIVRRLLRACELLEPDCLVHMLKAIKHLSMNSNLLDVLQNANAIEILTRILEEHKSGPYSTEMANHIFQTCYNLCRLNKLRQEEAAQAGIIPSLMRVIESQSPLKQFALPILCDLASAGKSCRMLLWQHDGLAMYIRLLADPYFQVSALESILSWLQEETARVEDELLKPHSLESLLKCFVSAKANSFENLLDPFLKICRLSTPITIGIAKSSFFRRIIEKLDNSKAVVKLNLLRILRTVCDVHPNRGILVERYKIHDLVGRLKKNDSAVLVRELAREIEPTLAPVLKPASAGRAALGHAHGLGSSVSSAGSSGSSGGLAMKSGLKGLEGSANRSTIAPKKRVRRTASEASAMLTPPSSAYATASRNGGGLYKAPGHGNGDAAARGGGRTRLGDIPWDSSERR